MSTEIEQAFDEWLDSLHGTLSLGDTVLTSKAFTAGVDYAAKRHIKDIEPIKEKK